MKKPSPAVLLLFVFLATVSGPAQADTWPRFRGPNGQGISEITHLPVKITRDHYLWRTQLPGGGQSSPVVWNDRIFLTCSRTEGERELVCLDAEEGKVLWTYADRFAPHRNHGDNTFVSSTPAVDAERVYVWWTDGDAYRAAAVDHEGNEVWRREMGGFAMRFGSGSSPVLAGGVLVVAKEHEAEDALVAGLDPATGAVRWTLPRRSGKGSYSTPAQRLAADGRQEIVCTSSEHGIAGIDPVTGRQRWSLPGRLEERCAGSAVVMGDLVAAFAGGGQGGREGYVVRPGPSPTLVHTLEDDLPYVPTPVAKDGRIYLWSDRGQLTCVNVDTGAVAWSERVAGRTYASPLWIGGRIYGIDREGLMVVVAAGDTFEELGRHQFEKGADATPAVANGRLYVRLDDVLVCVGPGAP